MTAVSAGKGISRVNYYFTFQRSGIERDVLDRYLQQYGQAIDFNPKNVTWPNGGWPHSGKAIVAESHEWVTSSYTGGSVPVSIHTTVPVVYDAIVTKASKYVLGVQGADCPSIFLYDAKARVIGLAHADWKPVVRGVVRSSNNRVAKGVVQCATKVAGPRHLSPLWLTSGSPITKDVVQLLVWEWTSFWLMLLMLNATLMYNGFFTNELSIDNFPRLTVTLIYAASYVTHSFYVWNVCSSFLTNVASGAAWSPIKRAMFAVVKPKHFNTTKLVIQSSSGVSTRIVNSIYQQLSKPNSSMRPTWWNFKMTQLLH